MAPPLPSSQKIHLVELPEKLRELNNLATQNPLKKKAPPTASRKDPAEQGRHRRRLEMDLKTAVSRGEISVAYQPRILLPSLRVAGAEALLRWRHSEFGSISPVEFVPIAEEAGLIGDLGAWVLEEACREAATWPERIGYALRVAVNVSPWQLDKPMHEVVKEILHKSELSPEHLELELTESRHLEKTPLRPQIEGLRELGIRLALDDFGTGHSSLSRLRDLPIDCLKVDQSFVEDIVEDNRLRGLLVAVLEMAQSLGIHTVVEGVESVAQLEILLRAGCGEVQGYFFAPAMPSEEFVRWVRRIEHID
jgi:EAL domain-containing protein (putative c-di-GMP-specific phosphodiesterase class I)